MATKTFRVTTANDGLYGQLSETDQAAASRTDCWTVGKIAANNSSDFLAGTKQATGTFSTEAGTPKPSTTLGTNNAFKTPAFFDGVFANTDWVFTFAMRANGAASSQTGRLRMRVFSSLSPDGAGATQLTSAVVVGTTTAALLTASDSNSVCTWSPGGVVTLREEYLFFALAWEIIVASGSNAGDAIMRAGSVSATRGCVLVTPDFAPRARAYPGVDSGFGHT